MSDAERDPVVRRAIDELQRVPAADAAAIRRVVAAAAAARVSPADDDPMVVAPRRRNRAWSVAGVAAVAAAAAFAGFAISNARSASRASVVPTSAVMTSRIAADSASQLQPVASRASDALPVVQQFVFNSRTAHRVSLVGDFNRWNPQAAQMRRASDGDSWSIALPILPGRHMYGFMVDDSVLMLDPRAPKGRDADLGTEGSVVIVGKP